MQPDLKQKFSSTEVGKILKLNRLRFQEWLKLGYSTPTKPADGPGTRALFSLLDVYNVALFKLLVDAGMPREKAKLYVENIRDIQDFDRAKKLNYIMFLTKHHVLSDKIIAIKGTSFNLDEIDKDMSGGGGWKLGLIINFKNIMDEIHDAIRSL